MTLRARVEMYSAPGTGPSSESVNAFSARTTSANAALSSSGLSAGRESALKA
jgi:hypothetical protein